jgi:Cell wall-active antibiotics response LiaF, C-terminal
MSGRIAFGAVIVGAGVLWLLSEADVVDLSFTTWVGILLIGLGIAIALSRGSHRLLVVVGVLVALVGIPALFVDDDLLSGGVGESTKRPETTADLEPFRHAVGKLTVDLTAPDLDLDEQTVEASVGIGELLVLVPEETDITVDAHVGVGNADVLGEEENGFDVDFSSISGTSGTQELTLDLEAGIGDIRVERG